jgi:hypothetical protein
LDSLGSWLTFWTALVVVGLAVEYWHELRDLLRIRPFDWKKLQVLIGGILITVGVAGELFVQFRAQRIETDLRTTSHKVEGLLNQEAEAARGEASSAKMTALQFQQAIAEANERAASATATAESEKLERVRLEAAVSPRTLGIDEQKEIAEALREFSGRTVTVSSYGMDGEGTALATEIIATLRSAGIGVDDYRASTIISGGFLTGVHVRGPAADTGFVTALGKELSSAGKLTVWVNGPTLHGTGLSGAAALSGSASISGGASVTTGPAPPGSPVTIAVGLKPLPILPK